MSRPRGQEAVQEHVSGLLVDRFMSTVVLRGALDARDAQSLEAVLAEGCGGSRHVLVDLTAVTLVDGAVLSLLVGVHRRLVSSEGFLVLVNPCRFVTARLRMMAGAPALPAFSDRTTALAWLRCVESAAEESLAPHDSCGEEAQPDAGPVHVGSESPGDPSTLLRGADDNDWAGRLVDALLTDRTQQRPNDRAVPMAADDQQVGVLGLVKQYGARTTT